MSPYVECCKSKETSLQAGGEVVWRSLDSLNVVIELDPEGYCLVVVRDKGTAVNLFYELLSKVQFTGASVDSVLEGHLGRLLAAGHREEGMGLDEELMIKFLPDEIRMRLPGNVLWFTDQIVLNELVMLIAPEAVGGDFPTHTPWGERVATAEEVKREIELVLKRLQSDSVSETHGD